MKIGIPYKLSAHEQKARFMMESDVTRDGRFSYRQIFFLPIFQMANTRLGFLKQISWVYGGEPNFSKQRVPTFITVVEVRTYIYCV